MKYDKFLNLVTNENILKYLDNRFSDSASRLESLQRIRFGIEEKQIPTNIDYDKIPNLASDQRQKLNHKFRFYL